MTSLIAGGSTFGFATNRSDQGLTESEDQESRQLAIQFSTRFVETMDLDSIVKDLYVTDFAEHYRSSKAKSLTRGTSPNLYFVPGLDYNARLLREADAKDWQRFYIATNNFVFFGVMFGIKNYSGSPESLKSETLYPSSVIKLLNSNPNLANLIERKGNSKAVSSVEEMHKAAATLEQAAALMREKQKGKPILRLDEKELHRVMKQDEFFRPRLEISDDEFDLPQSTRIIFINTPLLFRLMLVKAKGQIKILWADPFVID
ncbi:MAG TPA: hypothetical protein VFH15_12920 [Pyrinomonadaceae bacterium]|nr:hypothetical protein [Pyrinomonadaceae bacterium]